MAVIYIAAHLPAGRWLVEKLERAEFMRLLGENEVVILVQDPFLRAHVQMLCARPCQTGKDAAEVLYLVYPDHPIVLTGHYYNAAADWHYYRARRVK